ncbi:hypothetical protein ACIREE_33770 [Streptomyces sp. NPDC102467]|uniref:hypothetical protein n=1 Tax=Streptomyces sp. NPDC102467 TaxID=3366179 RepID=UPI0037F779FE
MHEFRDAELTTRRSRAVQIVAAGVDINEPGSSRFAEFAYEYGGGEVCPRGACQCPLDHAARDRLLTMLRYAMLAVATSAIVAGAACVHV